MCTNYDFEHSAAPLPPLGHRKHWALRFGSHQRWSSFSRLPTLEATNWTRSVWMFSSHFVTSYEVTSMKSEEQSSSRRKQKKPPFSTKKLKKNSKGRIGKLRMVRWVLVGRGNGRWVMAFRLYACFWYQVHWLASIVLLALQSS
jgi:hypothetical protein